MTQPTTEQSDPQTHFAIARAAYLTGDRTLERVARSILERDFGIRLSFVRPRRTKGADR